MQILRYVGPQEIRATAAGQPSGFVIESREALLGWLAGHADDEAGWRTYVVSTDGKLLLAPRRSEHIACAGGQDVLAAGEIRFDAGSVVEVTNNSTGFCPPETSWEPLRRALDDAGLARPNGFTFIAHFRRCPSCGERNLVKDEHYACALCDAELPRTWNFED